MLCSPPVNTPIATAHRNLYQRIGNMLDTLFNPTPWQIDMIDSALDDLASGRYLDGEFAMSRAERPDVYEPAGYKAGPVITVDDLRRRLGELAAP